MARKSINISQQYPRISDPKRADRNCLDDSALVPHQNKIPIEKLKKLIVAAVRDAEKKSGREALAVPVEATEKELEKFYQKEGKKLFDYWKKYVSDPAATAHQMHTKNYRAVGVELFRNRALQKGRMNSGWRYQFLVVSAARETKRFKSISDIGAAEADFHATIDFSDKTRYEQSLSLYVSVKNRGNTMGGQDWPKAIQALENVAKNDKNLTGYYCCVFGMAMDRGSRLIKSSKSTNAAYSDNTEVWFSDFFWPFFANCSYEEIMTTVLDVLIEVKQAEVDDELPSQVDVPDELLDAFGKYCVQAGLVDQLGNFNDPYKLVKYFCETPEKVKAPKKVPAKKQVTK